jgi:hypothetical protein
MRPTGDGWILSADRSIERVTILFPPGTGPTGASSHVSRQTIWGRPYDALSVTNLSAGETRHIDTVTATTSTR